MTSMSQIPEQFVEVCERLYGDVIDPAAIWEDVIKRSPDQADLHAQRNARIRRNVERSSNAVGIAAGTLGLAAAVKDPRLGAKGAGRLARRIARTGNRLPEVAGRIAEKHPKLGGAMAATAVGTQVANLGGDALIAGTLKDGQPKKRVAKSVVLVPTGVQKAFGLPDMRKVVAGMRRAWNPSAAAATKAPTASVKPTGGVQGVDLGAQMKAGAKKPTTRAEAKAGQEAAAVARQGARAKSAGQDVGRMLSTTSGKAAVGGLGLVGVGSAAGGAKRRRAAGSYEYADYGKSDTYEEVTFEGTFSKLDTDKRLAFGWASVSSLNGVPVIDRQGDYIDPEDLEEAAYAYVHKSRVGGDMHRRITVGGGDSAHKVSDMVESMVFTPDKIAKMGLPEDFPVGWWVGYKIHDDDTWDLVKKGLRTGFSIHGKGLRKALDVDQLMGA